MKGKPLDPRCFISALQIRLYEISNLNIVNLVLKGLASKIQVISEKIKNYWLLLFPTNTTALAHLLIPRGTLLLFLAVHSKQF